VTTHVIVQISSTIVHEPQLTSFLAYLENGVIPKYEAAVGMVKVYFLQRRFVAYAEMLTFSLWQSQEALEQFVESQMRIKDVKWEHDAIEVEPRSLEIVFSRTGKVLCDEGSGQI
jgi:hypothetical protein